MLAAVEVEWGAPPEAVVIWLHGLGADGHDFEGVVPQLGLPDSPGVRFVFPHAPVRPVTINGGMPMRAWYDVCDLDIPAREDEEGIRGSARRIAALIRREEERGIPASRIVLAGFSQGGAVALYAGLRHDERLAGILALSTYLPLAGVLSSEAHGANAAVPILMVHGRDDTVIPLRYGELSAERLRQMGYSVEWRVFSMGHSVCAEELVLVGAWLRRVLSLGARRGQGDRSGHGT